MLTRRKRKKREEEEEERKRLPQKLKVKRTKTYDDVDVQMPPTPPTPVVERKIRVRCPSNAKPGTKIQVNWRGRSFSTNIPDGVHPGQTFDVTTTASEKSDSSTEKVRKQE